MIIEGDLLTLGILNMNLWGIPASGAAELLERLPGLPLKICQDRAHGCDFNPSTKKGAAIGKIISAERVKNMIRIKADVSDQVAAYRILHNKLYPRSWSLFTGYKDMSPDKMLINPKPLAITIVQNPAYPGAGYNIVQNTVAAGLTDLDMYYHHIGAAAEPQPSEAHKDLSPLEEYYQCPDRPQVKKENPGENLKKALEKLNKTKPKITLQEALEMLQTKYRGK